MGENENKIEKQWYVVNTYSGHENKVKDNLEKRIETQGLQDNIFRVVVAEQEVPVLKEGVATGKTKMKNIYPGYIFVEMIMSDEAWFIVRNTPGVTGFVGSSGGHAKPFPVPREQIEPVLKMMNMVDASMYSDYVTGDLVKVLFGTYQGVEGNIVSIDLNLGEVQIESIIFGKPQLISAGISQIEKI